MKFAILGVGGVGGYFGGKLAASGADVTFIARGAHLAAMRAHGLTVRGPGESFVVQPVQATDDAQTVKADVVIVGVKTWQLADAIPSLCAMTGPETTVLPLLNGVEASDAIGAAVGAQHVLGGLCHVMSYVVAPGVIEHQGVAGSITFGELSGEKSARVEALRAAFASAHILGRASNDIRASLWKKFAFIASLGGVIAVTRAPAGIVRAVPETRDLLERAVAEVVALAKARGVALPDDETQKTMTYVDALPADGLSSMVRDLFAGRRSELDSWSGAVARLARESGIDSPVHDFIYRCLLPTERLARGELHRPAAQKQY